MTIIITMQIIQMETFGSAWLERTYQVGPSLGGSGSSTVVRAFCNDPNKIRAAQWTQQWSMLKASEIVGLLKSVPIPMKITQPTYQ
jgi:hypothetical protein